MACDPALFSFLAVSAARERTFAKRASFRRLARSLAVRICLALEKPASSALLRKVNACSVSFLCPYTHAALKLAMRVMLRGPKADGE